jgi:hypothetical protein
MPKTNLPAIYWYDKIDPVWWFGNIDEPRAPAWYKPDDCLRELKWKVRNPFSNLANYVIGFDDKRTVRSGWWPRTNGNPNNGWNLAITRWKFLYFPFVDYKHNRFELYFGWRERGNFGIKLNFRQALPKKKAVPRDTCLKTISEKSSPRSRGFLFLHSSTTAARETHS